MALAIDDAPSAISHVFLLAIERDSDLWRFGTRHVCMIAEKGLLVARGSLFVVLLFCFHAGGYSGK